MKYADLIDAVAAAADITKAKAKLAVDSVTSEIASAMAADDEVRLPDLGTFHVSLRAASNGMNPRTGEAIVVPAKRLAKFRPARALKEQLNPQPTPRRMTGGKRNGAAARA